MHRAHVLSGLENLQAVEGLLRGRRVGLMTNPTGVDHFGRSSIDILGSRCRLTALFAVEHGIRGDLQAGESVGAQTDPATGLPVFACYGHTERDRAMSDEMTDAFDVLVFDMQDVGARFYTYMYSMAYAMQACARNGRDMVVLDRINPLGGIRREGTVHKPQFASFVGNFSLPSRTGMTIGELALYIREYLGLDGLNLAVAPLKGWRREMHLCDTDVLWPAPSPNCATYGAALCYAGTCIFEGTNLSEGRGTTLPFELIGAPWIDARALADRLSRHRLPGVVYRAAAFRPTFSKHAGELCRGVQMHITDPKNAELFRAGLYILDAVRELYPHQLKLNGHLDLLLGTDEYSRGMRADALISAHAPGVEAFGRRIAKYLLY